VSDIRTLSLTFEVGQSFSLTFEPDSSPYNKRLLRQKPGGACLYMPEDGHCLASFEVIPPPNLVFPRPKK